MQITEDAPIEVTVYRSGIDAALVVEIDTTDETGNLRVNLNDGPIWEGDPESTTGPRELLMAIEDARADTHKVTPDSLVTADAKFRSRVETILSNAGVAKWRRT